MDGGLDLDKLKVCRESTIDYQVSIFSLLQPGQSQTVKDLQVTTTNYFLRGRMSTFQSYLGKLKCGQTAET